jgi:hypothetical protein
MTEDYEYLARIRLDIIRDQSEIIMDLRDELRCTQRKLKKALMGDTSETR